MKKVEVLTVGSKILVLSGSLKGQTKLVEKVKNQLVYLRDALKPAMNKKLYSVRIHRSSLKVLERNYKPPSVLKKEN